MKIQSQLPTPQAYNRPAAEKPPAGPSEPEDGFQGSVVTAGIGTVAGAGLGYLVGASKGFLSGAGGIAVGAASGAIVGMGVAFKAAQNDPDPSMGGAYQAAGFIYGGVAGAVAGAVAGGFTNHPVAAIGMAALGGSAGLLAGYVAGGM